MARACVSSWSGFFLLVVLLSTTPHCPSASSAIAKTVEALKEERLTHVRPAAFHANVILAVWQDGDLVAVVLESSAVSGEKRLVPSNREAPQSSVSRDSQLPPKPSPRSPGKQVSARQDGLFELLHSIDWINCMSANRVLTSRQHNTDSYTLRQGLPSRPLSHTPTSSAPVLSPLRVHKHKKVS